MNLLELREQLVKLSGRYDLVINPSDYEDNGANFFINAGQRWLDRKTIDRQTVTRAVVIAPINSVSIELPMCRNIQRAFVIDSANDLRKELERMWPLDIRNTYYGHSDHVPGTPVHYAPTFTRNASTFPASGPLAPYANFPDISPMAGANETFDGIIFGPACEREMAFEVCGRYYSVSMVKDTDNSYWSLNHPEILLQAAMRQIEVFQRNTEGVRDWDASITTSLMELDFDLVEEEFDGNQKMEG